MITVDLKTQALDKLKEHLANLSPAMADISKETKKIVERNFDTEGARLGKPWEPLSKDYAKWKAKKGKDKPILELGGHLKKSVTAASDSNSATVGTNLKYAIYHQEGRVYSISRTITTRLRTNANGSLKRQKGFSNLAVFASEKHKRFKESSKNVDYSATIPARPFMEITTADEAILKSKLLDYLVGK